MKKQKLRKIISFTRFPFSLLYQRPFCYRTVAFLLRQSCSLSFSFHHLFSKLLYKVSLNALLITLTDFMKGNHRFPLSRGPSLNLKCWHFLTIYLKSIVFYWLFSAASRMMTLFRSDSSSNCHTRSLFWFCPTIHKSWKKPHRCTLLTISHFKCVSLISQVLLLSLP